MAFKRTAKKEKSEFDQKILDIARVTRVVQGGRRFSFRVAAVIGNRNGKVGFGVGKGADVSLAMNKAVNDAKKHMISVKLANGTIPHAIETKYASARIMLMPAKPGRGIIAGGAVRVVCDFAGISDVAAKILSKSKNNINNAKAAVQALSMLKAPKVKKVKSEHKVEEVKEKAS